MTRLIAILACMAGLVACVDAPETASQDQTVCQDDPDTCPGGHPITLRVRTALEKDDWIASHPSDSVSALTEVHCGKVGNKQRCHLRIELYYYWVNITCDQLSDGSQWCTTETGYFPVPGFADPQLCKVDPDRCPNLPSFVRQTTLSEARSHHDASPTPTDHDVACHINSTSGREQCAILVYLPGALIEVVCDAQPDGSVWCTTSVI